MSGDMDPRRRAALLRRDMHAAIAEQNLERLRTALDSLYHASDSPLNKTGELKRPAAFAPVVEGLIAARRYANKTQVCKEMMLNFKHTHTTFKITNEEYETILCQLEKREAGEKVDWCAGTALHGIVKPRRYIKTYRAHDCVRDSSDGSDADEA
jgi:hypothetical protein